jgi:hypothetical protein
MESFIVLSGTVCSISRREQTARFNLRTDEGVFSVHLDGRLTDSLDGVLRSSVQVCVVGCPRSYYHRRRRTNLVYVEALACFALAE